MTHSPPRLGLILALFGTAFLYLCFFIPSGLNALASWTGSVAVDPGRESDFARLWYAGRELDSSRFGIPLSPWVLAHFHTDLFATTGNIHDDWLYPPTMSLLALLFALLPLKTSFWVFNLLSLAMATWVLRLSGCSWRTIVLGFAGPASLQCLIMGQNSVLLGSLLVSSLMLLENSPCRAGLLAGLLCLKPQAGLMLAAIVLPLNRLPVLLSASLSALALIMLSLLVEGIESWTWYLTTGRHAAFEVLATPFTRIFLGTGITPFFMARSFSLSLPAAFTIQAVSSALALATGFQLWRRPYNLPAARIAATLCLAALATPYSYFYDLAGFEIAAAAMIFSSPSRLRPLFALAWSAPGAIAMVSLSAHHIMMPLLLLATLLLALHAERLSGSSAANSSACS